MRLFGVRCLLEWLLHRFYVFKLPLCFMRLVISCSIHLPILHLFLGLLKHSHVLLMWIPHCTVQIFRDKPGKYMYFCLIVMDGSHCGQYFGRMGVSVLARHDPLMPYQWFLVSVNFLL
ncbi:unnamed protein product [Ixodes pacificus]